MNSHCISVFSDFFFFFNSALAARYIHPGWFHIALGPVCLLESSFLLESEFRESIFRCLVV